MVARGSGRVLHVGSGMGHRPNAGWSAYATSKAALSRLTDSLAAALDGTGVTVLEASPGLVRTDMTETMWGPPDEQAWNPVERMVDLVRRFARGELDALHGRFVHAARDDLDALLARAPARARRPTPGPCGCARTAPDDPLGLSRRQTRRGPSPTAAAASCQQDLLGPPVDRGRRRPGCRRRRSGRSGRRSVRELIMCRTTPVCRAWSKCRPCRATMSNRSSRRSAAQARRLEVVGGHQVLLGAAGGDGTGRSPRRTGRR